MRHLILSACLMAACATTGHAANASINVSVTVTIAAIDISWDAACRTGGDTATLLYWTLGNQAPGAVVNGETSATYPRSCVVLSNGADVQVAIKTADTVGGTPWTAVGAAGADQFLMEAKHQGGGAAPFNGWRALTTADQVLKSVVAQTGTIGFWLRFNAPTSSTDATAKTITVTATATSPP